jgi:ATP-binding cassette subfamily C protein LapB
MIGSARSKSSAQAARLGAVAYMPGGVFDLILTTFFINVLALAMPMMLLQVYDRIIPNTATGTLILLVAGVGTALLLEALLRAGRSYVSGWMGARFEHLAGCAALERLLSAHITDFERQGSGVHMERFNALNTLKEFYAGQAILALCDLPFAVVYMAAIAWLAGWLVLVPIVLIVLFAASAVLVGQKLKGAIEGRMQADDRRFNFIIEVLGGVHTVKSLAMEEQMLRRYERLQEHCAEGNYGVAMASTQAAGLGVMFSQITMFLVVGFGSILVIDGALTVGGLAACTMLAGRSMQPLQKAVGVWTRFQSIRLARDRLAKIFAMKPEAPAGLPELPKIEGAIELQNVSFNYGKNRDGEQLPNIVSDVSLRVAPGEAVGVAGGNASGKSTLLYLMMGALKPTEGRILIDGNDIGQFDPISVRGQIAYLPQQGALFNGTLLENITMFREDKEPIALDMARLLGLDNVVAHMPLGYDTKVGEGVGDALPRGIKQRIAIARALVEKPRILLFDEANTAMDGAGDAMLKRLLERLKGHVTLVLVTPRPSLMSLADRIFDLADGRVSERPPAPPRIAEAPPPAGGAGDSSDARAKRATGPTIDIRRAPES